MKRATVFLMLLVVVKLACSEIVVTEIMYDVSGSESGREWIELYNSANTEKDITGWKLNESNKLHTLSSSSYILSSKSYAIITYNKAKFLIDYPYFKGNIFETSGYMQLSNGGEKIIIENSQRQIMDSVEYADLADEDHSIELKCWNLNNSYMEHWAMSTEKGTPGYGSIDCENDGIPEFNTFGISMVILGIVVAVKKRLS
ncbi:lamin tail domain-containing protein [Candidatus Woesearchaeota archaeon]|nr:lamin tail domain-containing protein [Candidatus Woesearchaeota archaeon]